MIINARSTLDIYQKFSSYIQRNTVELVICRLRKVETMGDV